MYDSLHLTEMSRTYDTSLDKSGVIRGSYATNETHVADRQIIRMMLAVPDLVLIRGELFSICIVQKKDHLFTKT